MIVLPSGSMATMKAGEASMRVSRSRISRRSLSSARRRSVMSRIVAIMPTGSPVWFRSSELCISVGKTVPSRRTCQISPLNPSVSRICRLAASTAGICSGVWNTESDSPTSSSAV